VKRSKKTAAVDTAAGRLSVSYWPAAEGLIEKVDPYRKQVTDAVGPLAHEARRQGAHAAHTALERVTPVLDDAWDRATPAVEAARARVQGDLLPRLNSALADAAGHPVAQEAAKRGRATAAALRGEIEPAKPKKGRRARKVLGGLAIVAAIGGAVVAVKKYLDSRDAEWEAPAPSTYGGSNTPKRAGTSPWAATSDPVSSPAADADTSGSSATPAGGSTSGTSTPATPPSAPPAARAADTSSASSTDAADGATASAAASSDTVPGAPSTSATASTGATPSTSDEAEPVERKTYGPGSYVGSKPPKGFEVKGNERSMKYHTPDSPAYERTISDVWFNSTEAAENNGFSRAQR